MTLPKLSTYGGLKEGDLYIERLADRELLSTLERCDYAYVLSSRQTGKTSLMSRTSRKLRSAGYRCAKVDLGAIGTEGEPSQWYLAMALEVAAAAGYEDSLAEGYFASTHRGTPIQRFLHFLRDLVAQSEKPLVIFVDEIEGFLKLPMRVTDDFLAAIRSCYNDRDREPLYRRLAFCLTGVCTPTELIRDERRTPFNVARGIDLADFTWEDVRAGFLPVFNETGPRTEETLKAIFGWGGGHPYLTHRLVEEAYERHLEGVALEPAQVDSIVQERFLSALGREQENFLEVERRLCLGQVHRVQRRLSLYKSILNGEVIPASGQDIIQLELRLTGLVREFCPAGEQPRLVVRNRIFASVFHAAWTPKAEPTKLDPARWMKEQTDRWIEFGRKDAFVLRGEELLEAQKWAGAQGSVEPTCQEFLKASRRVDDQERAIRINSLLVTTLLASAVTFLLPLVLHDYWRYRGYPLHSVIGFLYGLPFVLALPSGIVADRLKIGPLRMLWAGLGLISLGALLLFLDRFIAHAALAFMAVLLILLGQTLQRPHHAVLFGLLYPRSDRRLDFAFVGFYLAINLGSLFGPLIGAAIFQQYSWNGVLLTVFYGSCLSWLSLLAARKVLTGIHFLPENDPQESPGHTARRRRAILWLLASMLIFWWGFDQVGSLFQRHIVSNAQITLGAKKEGGDVLATGNLLAQGLSSGAITPLFVLFVAPLLMVFNARLQHRQLHLSATMKLAVGLLLLAVVLVHMVLGRYSGHSLLGEYLLLTLAELLVVPVSMSLTTALSTTANLSSVMGGYYLVLGAGSWLGAMPIGANLYTASTLALLCAFMAVVYLSRQSQWTEILPSVGLGERPLSS